MEYMIATSSKVIATESTIEAIYSTMGHISTLLTQIYSYEYAHIQNKIKELDIQVRLKTIAKIVDEIKAEKKNIESLDICLSNVQEIIEEVKKELNNINEVIEYHETKWFYAWRTIYYQEHLEKLTVNMNILNERYKMLLDIIKLHNISLDN